MKSKTNETALESSIQKTLTGYSQEELKTANIPVQDASELYRKGEGFYMGLPQDYNPNFAIDEKRFWNFLEQTQAKELAKIQKQNNWQLKIKERLNKLIKKYGVLHLLKKGLEIDDAHFILFYQSPLASSSQSVKDKFAANQFSVTRQVRYNVDNQREEIDLVLFLNGLAIITVELKNPWTLQTAKVNGIHQYKFERDATQPLLQFGRCLVHFTADTDEAYMTTRLNGKKTFFLPFNKGHQEGKGNPPNPFGHKTAYLWEEVFTRKSLANIIQHFVRFDGKLKDPLHKRTLFFPRYHQMDVVRKIVDDASQKGVGQTYLIQHSAGSGKSYSITWAAFQLIEAYPNSSNANRNKGLTSPLFDSVIVVTDRRLLDRQIRDNITDFSEVKNIVAPASSSKDLRDSLEQGKKIIITTIQKFPFIVDGIADLSHKNFAVIIDEAHSSQGGLTAGKMNQAMGTATPLSEANDATEAANLDTQEKILRAIKSRKMKGNASYLAFTATPKNATLERFGNQQANGTFKPFHLYSMKQAIEEGFILDVLANYTTYRSYYEIQKSIADNPIFESQKAQKKLRAYVEQHEHTIGTKVGIMLAHFTSKVVSSKKLKGKAKGMVVTQSIKSAITYYKAIKKYLADKGKPFDVLVAFSGKKTLNGIEYTEENLNKLPAHLDTAKPSDPDYITDKLARYFDMDEYRLLVVANKYLTGFDQPKLCTMYVDKKLQGVLAVQALSRLNRSANKLDKRTEDLFILDFFNTTDDIQTAFEPFYTATSLSSATDVNVLHDIKGQLDEIGVYEWQEVVNFNEQYFNGVPADNLSPIIDKAAERFTHTLELEAEEKASFKIQAKQFVKIYGQMAAIMRQEIVRWEQLFWFLKFLIPKLPIPNTQGPQIDALLDSVDLSTYGLQRVRLNQSIALNEAESQLDPQNPNPRGTHGGDEEDTLDAIIAEFNERWFSGWEATPEEQRMKLIQMYQSISQHSDYDRKYAQNPDEQNRDLALQKMIDEVLSKQRRQELGLYKLHAKDDGFKQAFFITMKRMLEGNGGDFLRG